jgi:tetratricopeptide (TPR) repeat protein
MATSVETLTENLLAFLMQDDAQVLIVEADDAEVATLLNVLPTIADHDRGITVSLPNVWNDTVCSQLFEGIASDGVLGIFVCEATLDDPTAWAARVRHLVSNPTSFQSRIRWIVRALPEDLVMCEALATQPESSVVWIELASSHETLEDKLVAVVDNMDVPSAERLKALHQLAWIDLSHGHYDEAYEYFGVLYDSYHRNGDVPMQCLSLQGAATVHLRQNRPTEALSCFQSAIAAGLTGAPSHALHAALLNAAMTSFQIERLDDAEAYYFEASRLAAVLRNVSGTCDALMRAGVVAMRRNNMVTAFEHWEQCRRIAVKWRHDHATYDVLVHLYELYQHVGLHEHAQQIGADLTAITEAQA